MTVKQVKLKVSNVPLSDQYQTLPVNLRLPPRHLEPWLECQYNPHRPTQLHGETNLAS